MMGKKPMRQYTARAVEMGLEDLLRAVPTRVLINMVTKANLPAHEARLLCKKLKELKA
jgi:hypothetical protein